MRGVHRDGTFTVAMSCTHHTSQTRETLVGLVPATTTTRSNAMRIAWHGMACEERSNADHKCCCPKPTQPANGFTPTPSGVMRWDVIIVSHRLHAYSSRRFVNHVHPRDRAIQLQLQLRHSQDMGNPTNEYDAQSCGIYIT